MILFFGHNQKKIVQNLNVMFVETFTNEVLISRGKKAPGLFSKKKFEIKIQKGVFKKDFSVYKLLLKACSTYCQIQETILNF